MLVSQEIRSKIDTPILSAPVYMKELETKYLNPIEKTI